jgi:hypothetical protein
VGEMLVTTGATGFKRKVLVAPFNVPISCDGTGTILSRISRLILRDFREYMDGDKRAYVLVAGKHQFFPRRELETIDYRIEDTYRGLYQELRGYLGKPRKTTSDPQPPELTYARYGLWRYVKIAKQKHEPYASLHRAGSNLRGLVRVLLFKRFESSVFAFQETIRRFLRIHDTFLKALDAGFVPAPEDAQSLLYESDRDEEVDLLAQTAECVHDSWRNIAISLIDPATGVLSANTCSHQST